MMKLLLPKLKLILFAFPVVMCVSAFLNPPHPLAQPMPEPVASVGREKTDTLTSTIVLYRPDNQLSRKYYLTTNIKGHGTMELGKNQEIVLHTNENQLMVGVSATAHKKQAFSFTLSPRTTHYFRIQDRNNFSGYKIYLEIIEVTPSTYKRDKMPMP